MKDAKGARAAGSAPQLSGSDAVDPEADAKAKARRFFDMAIKAGDVNAQRLLGEALITGDGLPKDQEQGRALLEEAAKTDTQAQASLGRIYLTGAGLPKDTALGLELLERAASSGNVFAMNILGMSYLAGKDLPIDTAKARTYLARAAKAGDRTAQRHLAEALIKGQGLQRNTAEGVALLLAAAKTDTASQLMLGRMYFTGTGIPRDTVKALPLLEAAAAAGNSSALEILGTAHLIGRDAPLNPRKAEALLRRAMVAGDASAGRNLALALVQGRVLQKNAAEGLRLLQEASDRGDQKATLVLGQIFLRGEDVPQDLPRATALFEELAANGNGKGLEILGNSYLWGTYTAARPEAAEAFLSRAGDLGRRNVWSSLANGAMAKLLGAKSLSRFNDFAKKARAVDDPRIDVYEAERQLRGAGVRRNVRKAVARLKAAASAGNGRAVAHLISLYRDGRRRLIRKDPKKARAYLRDYSDKLSDAEAGLQKFLIDVAAARSTAVRPTAEFEALAGNEANAPYLGDFTAQDDILKANANFAVYRIQKSLQTENLYDGPLNGLLTSTTLNAMQSACRELAIYERCRKKALTPDIFTRLTLGWRFSIENY